MGGERSSFPALIECWERRIGYWLDDFLGLYDPGQEITRSLYPNDQPEARLLPATSYRSLAWPLTPLSGFRHSPTGEV